MSSNSTEAAPEFTSTIDTPPAAGQQESSEAPAAENPSSAETVDGSTISSSGPATGTSPDSQTGSLEAADSSENPTSAATVDANSQQAASESTSTAANDTSSSGESTTTGSGSSGSSGLTGAAAPAEPVSKTSPSAEGTSIEHCLAHLWDDFFAIYSRVGYFTEEHAKQLLHFVATNVDKLANKI